MGNLILDHQRRVILGTFLKPLPPAVLEDGNTVAWYDYEKTDTLTVDGSNYVSRWNDRLGSGRDLIQATGTNQPILNSDGLLFDGVDNFLKTAAFTLNQPETIYIVAKVLTYVGLNHVCDGNANESGAIRLNNTNAAIALAPAASSIVSFNSLFNIFKATFNGVTSKFSVMESAVTGNFGANNMGGFTLARVGSSPIRYSNIIAKEAIIRKVADNSTDETAIYNYLKKKYAL